MTFPVVGSNIPTTYQISNSLRFNDGDNPNLYRTFSSSGSRTTWTFSTWVKKCEIADTQFLFGVNSSSNPENNGIYFRGDDKIEIDSNDGGNRYYVITTPLYRDVSAWYHVVCYWNTTDATASNRFKVYINGEEQTIGGNNYPPQNYEGQVNRNVIHRVGGAYNYTGTYVLDGYLAETHFIDGQALAPSNFAEADEDSGVWKPKQYAGTYGTNGFYLKYSNTGNIGEDSSGNDNTFTPTNLSGTTDVTTDTPTNNFATINVLDDSGGDSFSEGNTVKQQDSYNGTSSDAFSICTQNPSSGKWYWESKCEISGSAGNRTPTVVTVGGVNHYKKNVNAFASYGFDASLGDTQLYKYVNGTGTALGDTFNNGDILSVALDLDNLKMYAFINGSEPSGQSISSGTALVTLPSSTTGYEILIGTTCDDGAGNNRTRQKTNFGNPSFSISSGNSDENGYGNFEYAPPSGYLALCTQNLATALSPTIDDGSAYFHTQLYTGNGTDDRSITNDANAGDFSPDFLWVKNRTSANGHALVDTTRGATKVLRSQATNAEETEANGIQAFETDGFQIGTSGLVNTSANNYVAWQWKANGGTTSSNTDGSITSTVQANTTAGFSIVTYTGTGASATVGHGLGKTPSVLIIKNRGNTRNWAVWNKSLSSTYADNLLTLNTTDAVGNNSVYWGGGNHTSTTFELNTSTLNNENTYNHVAYCFAEIEGYSKFGSYTGNGSTDSPFIYLGFRPAWILFKSSSYSGQDWVLMDAKRTAEYNPTDGTLYPNKSDAEYTLIDRGDILSNGYKLRNTSPAVNQSGQTYIYMAFAENPFVTSGAVPVTAR